MAMLEAARREILVEIEKLDAKVNTKHELHLSRHEAEAQTHLTEHRREADRRAGMIRWAVTTLMTGVGVLLALYVAFKG
jgi:hypothetical protein